MSGQRTERIGKYEVLGHIGKGGMSSVYRARISGPAEVSKEVALKLIHAHLSQDHSFVLMFLEEMRVAMAMAHRNIVQTFDADQAGKHYYLVMELVDGCSLRDLLEQATEGLPLDIVLFVAREIASALDYAHNLGAKGTLHEVIHRDVSPGNILLSRQGDVKLTDFGVAKATGRTSATQRNVIKGKLDYMAPEQARGKPSRRSDVFSLGAVIYQSIAGRLFRDNASLEQVRSHKSSAIVPLSRIRPETPLALEALVVRMLSADSKARPTTKELRRELNEHHQEALRHQAGGVDHDPHERLKRFLAERIVPTASGGGGKTARLADAMWAELEGLPTDPNLRHAETASMLALKPTAIDEDSEDSTTDLRRFDLDSSSFRPLASSEAANGDPRLTTTPFRSKSAADPRLTTAPFERPEADDLEEQRRTTEYERVSREEAKAASAKEPYQTIQYEPITEEELAAAAREEGSEQPTTKFDRRLFSDDAPKTAAVWVEEARRRRWWALAIVGVALGLAAVGIFCAVL